MSDRPWPLYQCTVKVRAVRIQGVEPLKANDPAVLAKPDLHFGVRVYFENGYPPVELSEDQIEDLPFLKAGNYLARSAQGGYLCTWSAEGFADFYRRMSPHDAARAAIEQKIDDWHSGESEQLLHDHLGWTLEEYGLFVERNILPAREIEPFRPKSDAPPDPDPVAP